MKNKSENRRKKSRISMMSMAAGLIVSSSLATSEPKLWSQADTIFAQKLAEDTLAKHRTDMNYIGLHLIPPNGTNMVIVAATDRTKIGKQSSAGDVKVVEGGIPVMEMKGTSTSVLQRLHDRAGQTIGMFVVNLKFTDGQESEAAKLTRMVDRELAKQVVSKAALFEPVK